jgi:endonuclease YncB( thermonuclease family)
LLFVSAWLLSAAAFAAVPTQSIEYSFFPKGKIIRVAEAAHADEQDFSGTVGRIFDGDSFLVRPATGRDVDVRLQDIDAPEKSQPYGDTARTALVKLIRDRKVFVDVIETDHYGRKIVRVYRDSDRLDVAKALVRDGHVWVYRRTVHDRSLVELEEAARASHRGLWALPEKDRMPPWQYRYLQRQKPKRADTALPHFVYLESAQAARFHQAVAPVTSGVVIFPGAESGGEARSRWTVVIPQSVEITDQLDAQR